MRLFTPRKHGVRTACCVRSYLAAVIKLLACEIEPRNTVGTYCSSRRTIYWTLIKCCKTRCTRRVDCNDKKCISFFLFFMVYTNHKNIFHNIKFPDLRNTPILSGIKVDFQLSITYRRAVCKVLQHEHMNEFTYMLTKSTQSLNRTYSWRKQICLCACIISGVSLCCIYTQLNMIFNFFPLKMAATQI